MYKVGDRVRVIKSGERFGYEGVITEINSFFRQGIETHYRVKYGPLQTGSWVHWETSLELVESITLEVTDSYV